MFARTERLYLRPGFPEDAPALAAAIGDEAVARNLSALPWPYGVAQAAAFIGLPDAPLLPRLLIVLRTDIAPRLIGGIGIHPREGEGDGGALELGYWIARAHWGRGFATEAGRAVMDIARANRLPRLTARHFTDNPASGAVLRKLGFSATGRSEQRSSAARGGAAMCAGYEEGTDVDADAAGLRAPMPMAA
ncbi:MAG: GNAT family N-acetyltransferase [Sphingopyxis sp.]